MSRSDLLDLLGVCLLAVFAFAVWPPLTVAVLAVACFLASRAAD